MKHLLVLAILCIFGSPTAFSQNNNHNGSLKVVSISRVEISDNEHVVSFQIKITAGMIRSVSNLPKGWYVAIDNNASWRTNVKANTLVGAAAMSARELRNVRFVIEKDETYTPFSVDGTVRTTTDFEKERALTLTMKDFMVSSGN